ncbi:hypothetical protein [Pseudomonas sp. S2_H01]
MNDGYRNSGLCGIDWLSNEELGRLIANVVVQEKGASQQLFAAVAPLLMAFYEGQVQAGRARHEHLETLVQEAFMVVHQRSASFDCALSTRAWLIDIARCKLVDYLQSIGDEALVAVSAAVPFASEHVRSKAL